MSDFRCCIRKFIEKLPYWANSDSNNCSMDFVIEQCLSNKFLKFGTGKLLKLLTEFSDCEVWQKRLFEITARYCSCSVV